MAEKEPLIRNVSDTALWVASYRADESDRPDAIFHDRLARKLAGKRGAEIARGAKQPAVRTAVVLRTAMIDELVERAVRERGFDSVLNLAAGLDARPYRLDVPAGLNWYEADFPALMEYKEAIIGGETPRCHVERVSIDLTDRALRLELFERIGRENRRVFVLTEGLLSYLRPEEVARLAEDLQAQASFAEWVTDLAGGQMTNRARTAGDKVKGENAPCLFAPKENTQFFRPYGWVEEQFYDLFAEAPRLGRDSRLGRVIRVVLRFAPRAVKKGFSRALGVAVLGRADKDLADPPRREA